MLMGIKLAANPSTRQKIILSQWMGGARVIWNAKCAQWKYESTFARKYLPLGNYANTDASYSQFKDKELTPYLYSIPSQIMRNSASEWRDTMKDWKDKNHPQMGPAQIKKGKGVGSIWLTKELFRFDVCEDGVTRLFIGTKKNNIGYLPVKFHRNFTIPNSIRVKKKNGSYWVAFCYDDGISEDSLFNDKENLEFLKECTPEYLNEHTIGIDRGVVRPVQFGSKAFDFTEEQKRKKVQKEKYIKRYQKRLSKQKKGSKRRSNTKLQIAKAHQKIANIRKDFCHKTSHAMVSDMQAKILIFEDLNTKGMTKRPKAKKNESGGWDKNRAKAKAGLNKAILDKGWHKLEEFTKYKAYRAGKAVFKVSAHHTSQECVDCEHIHPNNRKTQAEFVCKRCGHTDNADRNAAGVLKKRAIKLILHSGTELSKRGVLLDSGRGAKIRRGERKATHAVATKRQKRQERPSGQLLEATPL